MSNLILSEDGQQALESFICPVCHIESFLLEDIRQGYCGACHKFTGFKQYYQRELELIWPVTEVNSNHKQS